ncbi:MAG: formylglycine-generating enzyme family protein [Deltaproteobacteria bacterium]|nr:formylglycine-generating enzyme family protein [Deltaproteobacteria bacterium]
MDPDCGLCGNGIVEGGELCDRAAWDDQTLRCQAYGYDGGQVACHRDCTPDFSGCFTSTCGDGVIEGPEECEGEDLAGQTCAGLGNLGGTLGCDGQCRLDDAGCERPECTPACENGGRCVVPGVCECPSAWSGPTCEVFACEPPCGAGGTCVGPDTCECAPGWFGPGCDTTTCSPECANNSTCVGPNTCGCAAGWSGSTCETPVCSPSCGPGGTCSGPNRCTCAPGWSGPTCETAVCSPACGAGGTCVGPNACECAPGWSGPTCGGFACASACENGGTCVGPDTCACAAGWTGPTCGAPACTPACRNGGTCTAPNTCACSAGWTGPACGAFVCASTCQNGGECVGPDACACAAGWTGATCGTFVCESACRNDGECVGPNTCECAAGWVGDQCELKAGMVLVPAGTFTMGSPSGELGRWPDEVRHAVTLTRSVLMQESEVTQGQWKALSGGVNPACFQAMGATTCSAANANDAAPVERVSWYSALGYANALSDAEGLPSCYTLVGCADTANGWKNGVHWGCTGATFAGLDCAGYRLPTESEWEYAARAGTTTATYAGDLSGTLSDCSTPEGALDGVAWWRCNSSDRTWPVAQKAANAWGLYDMLGNVGEWTWDWYGDYPGATTDPLGPDAGSYRVVRGGSWVVDDSVRAASRGYESPSTSGFSHQGFRLCRTASAGSER